MMQPAQAPSGEDLPLSGLRILDLSSILGGPIAATFLADFGADVTKVELPQRGDPIRWRPGPKNGLSYIWLQENRNKRAITLDLHFEEGQALLKQLVTKVDGLIENFRPGTLEKWNVGSDVLLEANPNLVMLRLSGFGQTGPNREKGAFDRIAEAFGGLQFVTGYPEMPPVRPGYAIADYMLAYVGAFSMMMALYWRDARGGQGQVIDLALYEPVLRASEMSIPIFHATGAVRRRAGHFNPYVVPSSCFATADDQWVVIGANTQRLWERLARAMGREDLLQDDRFRTTNDRVANPEPLYEILESWTRSQKARDIVQIMDDAGVPAAIVNSIADIFEDPHVQERQNIVVHDDPRFGDLAVPGILPRLSHTPGTIRTLGPDLGADNEAIYGEWLGLSREEIDRLRQQGVI